MAMNGIVEKITRLPLLAVFPHGTSIVRSLPAKMKLGRRRPFMNFAAALPIIITALSTRLYLDTAQRSGTVATAQPSLGRWRAPHASGATSAMDWENVQR